jgi:hypothetical protein
MKDRRVKRRGKGKRREKRRRLSKAGEVESVEVKPESYRRVEGYCRLCGAKIHGDIALVSHALDHGEEVTVEKYLRMDDDFRYSTISRLAYKLLSVNPKKL